MNKETVLLPETLHTWAQPSDADEDAEPLRLELFSAAQMALHGKHLAARHTLSAQTGPDRLLPRLADNAALIADACSQLTAAVTARRQVTPASEWLLDNFYLIEDQIRTARRHLPRHYSRELPRLSNADADGMPRVYQIALEIIAHGDGRVDPESLARFVIAYQEVAPLRLGELWAIPIMLRLALIENLRRVAARVAANRAQRDLANAWAEKMVATADANPGDLILVVADMARSKPPMNSGFVAELARRLQGQAPTLGMALQWITTQLAEHGSSIEQMIQAEIGQQAADQVSVANSIGSLRFLSTMDWQEFVETMSPVEQALRLDPAGIYGKMDFATRDQYRHVVEKFARHSQHSEQEVAARALALAGEQRDLSAGGLDLRRRHVGYYLVGKGRARLEQDLGVRLPFNERLGRIGRRAPLGAYLGSMALLTMLFAAAGLVRAMDEGIEGGWLVALGLLFVLCGSQLALSLVNFFATQLTRPNPLPRMDFRDGLPSDAAALVAIPTLLSSETAVEELCETLEVHYLANRDPQLRFCLLTDFPDAPAEHQPGDQALLDMARARIEALNDAHGSGEIKPFLLLHRPRRWNPGERAWMGYERKRGKLCDLNRMLRGGQADAFSLVVGDTSVLPGIRYVITLDTDTQLPRDAARQFVATMMHPLNQPLLSPDGLCVIDGYGLLQPRVAVSLPSEHPSRYEILCGGEPGIDPYTRTVSDVYQDVFGEGSFIGKGIYDVDVFERVLGRRWPENQVLSHDLLEGCYLRAGLLSDAQLYEQYPPRYADDVARRHRWIRGDWQLAGWLRGKVPGPAGQREKNPLSALSRWKLFDNLRRSLVPAALTATLVLAWTLMPSPWFWTAAILAVLFLPAMVATLVHLVEKPSDMLWHQHWHNVLRSAGVQFGQALMTLAFLPYEAHYSLDAVLRTLWRGLVSHRHMLEWRASSLARAAADLPSSWHRMWFAPLFAMATAVLLQLAHPAALAWAAPVLLLWFMSPAIAWWLSLPVRRHEAELSQTQEMFLQALARKTWSFFETFVTAEENWLPPDNMQEHPSMVVAHRTSPTNIGMSMLANLSAWDFGYITGAELVQRTEGTLATLARLERYNGHFYNWYDTLSLAPLHPMYVSSVDSGNFAGHLLTLAPGLEQLADAPIVNPRLFEGIAATLLALEESLPPELRADPSMARLRAILAAEHARTAPATLPGVMESLDQLQAHIAALRTAAGPAPEPLMQSWLGRLESHVRSGMAELVELAPWMAHARSYVIDSNLTRIPTLRELAAFAMAGAPESDLAPAERERQGTLAALVAQGRTRAAARMNRLSELAAQSREFAQMDFRFLYNPTTKLLSIGYNVSDRRLDDASYDLLASEIRLASYVAIAQGQLPQEHWFAMGRQLCIVGNEQVLLSWSGSMFEYLMPLLVMPTYPNTLLDQTYRSVVRAQAEYGKQREVPWGISESGYNTTDANLNYQYRAFGVPGIGLKRGLADDLVIAPYATMMALMVEPDLACDNLQRMQALGFMGRYGFYEAVDYTVARLPRGESFAIVRSFMAHHQGMAFLAMSYLLHDRPMQRRFESDPQFQAAMLVLQERVPKAGAFYSHAAELADLHTPAQNQAMPLRILNQVSLPQPELQLLSNGRYHVMVSSTGGGYSRWRDLAVTRWREDGTCDNWGQFAYLRDADSGHVWSASYQPTRVEPERYEVIFSEGRAEFRRLDRGIELYTEMVVSPEDDIEMRRTRVTNHSSSRRTLEFTSYAEVVIAPPAADNAHPAFSKLFVQTEILRKENAILCTRRARKKDETPPWMLHLLTAHDAQLLDVSYETSRPDFIGRGHTAHYPQAMIDQGPLGGSEGSVLDPVVAIRYRFTLEPDQTVIFDAVTGMAEQREAAVHLIDKYQDRHLADRVFGLAWTQAQVVLRQLNASETEAQLYSRIASPVIYPSAALRADQAIIRRNQRGQPGLWAYAISGDLPIVLLILRDGANIELARQLVQAHAYWRLKGLAVDLVIWYEEQGGYRQALHDQIIGLISSGIDAQSIDRPGGVFVRLVDQVAPDDRALIQAVARIVIDDGRGELADQVKRAQAVLPKMAMLATERRSDRYPSAPLQLPPLILDNGIGGFTPDGREYVMRTGKGKRTPLPWCNVLANPNFGSIVTESGQAYTWSENAHEFRLTPWENDPVSDLGGEAFYLRDEVSGRFWSPSPLPVAGQGDYITRHGFGYSVFEHAEDGIHSEMLCFVALDANIKYTVLTIRNDSPVARRMSATGYVEWVIGDLRPRTAMHVVTELDNGGALLARNQYNTEFHGRVGFFHVDAPVRSATGDRLEFIGRNGSLRDPVAMKRARLSGRTGAALDPCGALMAPVELAPGESRQLVFMLGVGGRRTADASQLVSQYNAPGAAAAALEKVRKHWDQVLGAVQIESPDPALNVLANGWLMYQTIACRLWARSGFYQSGGAFGYRDQLQDAMAVVHTEPQLLREQILLCAQHQFVEGDVQHWWHPPSGRGVRTHCSDDYLWLPLAVQRYVSATGDRSILDEHAGFIEGRPLRQDEESYYDMPAQASQRASIYEHCVRAIRHGLRFGVHGLPLIGTCDWNDGMDRVGHEGKGESVWLAWFLFEVLQRFAEVAVLQGDQEFALTCRTEAATLARNVEENAWDGEWYRRAYFDDGTPLGSASNDECQIDSISQSWGVLSGAANVERVRGAMAQVDARLVRRDHGLIQLLDPPFDDGILNPGYIRGYVPGVRENGGQYTHAAIWTAMAFAQMGEADKAWELLHMISPVQHGDTAEGCHVYKAEPYVVAADVYAVPPHVGRGGWTWYTGSSGWMYRLIIESLVGLRLEGGRLSLTPLLPSSMDQLRVHYRYRSSVYVIDIRRGAERALTLDGEAQQGGMIPLNDDGRHHEVSLILPV